MTDGGIHGFKHTGFPHFIMYLRHVSVISFPRRFPTEELNRSASQLEYFIRVTNCKSHTGALSVGIAKYVYFRLVWSNCECIRALRPSWISLAAVVVRARRWYRFFFFFFSFRKTQFARLHLEHRSVRRVKQRHLHKFNALNQLTLKRYNIGISAI